MLFVRRNLSQCCTSKSEDDKTLFTRFLFCHDGFTLPSDLLSLSVNLLWISSLSFVLVHAQAISAIAIAMVF